MLSFVGCFEDDCFLESLGEGFVADCFVKGFVEVLLRFCVDVECMGPVLSLGEGKRERQRDRDE